MLKKLLIIKVFSFQKENTIRVSLKFNPAFEKIKSKFNLWLLRDLSLRGRVLLSKAEGISRLIYIASTIYLDNKTVKSIDQILFNFLWKNHVHYIHKSVVINSLKNGGLDFLDFFTLTLSKLIG